MKSLLIKYFYIALIIPFVLSCTKDVVQPEPEPPAEEPHVAGDTKAGDIHESFVVPMSIDITWDAQILYGYGEDSLDIDQDGNFDLFFRLSVLNPDSIQLLTGMPNPFPYCWVNSGTNTSFEAVAIYENVPIGLGQSTTYTFVDALTLGQEYTSLSAWESLANYGKCMWGENPGGGGTPSFGPWYDLTEARYIGFRLNGKFGWVKIDTTDPYNPLILEYNLEA